MGDLVKSFDVSVLLNKRLNDGVLEVSPEGFFFYGDNDICQERKVNWELAECTYGEIELKVLRFFTTKRKAMQIKDGDFESYIFIINDKEEDKIRLAMREVIETRIHIEELKRIEDQRRLEEEQKRFEEQRRLEEEQRRYEEQHRLEEEQRLYEEQRRREEEQRRYEEQRRREEEQQRLEEQRRFEEQQRLEEEQLCLTEQSRVTAEVHKYESQVVADYYKDTYVNHPLYQELALHIDEISCRRDGSDFSALALQALDLLGIIIKSKKENCEEEEITEIYDEFLVATERCDIKEDYLHIIEEIIEEYLSEGLVNVRLLVKTLKYILDDCCCIKVRKNEFTGKECDTKKEVDWRQYLNNDYVTPQIDINKDAINELISDVAREQRRLAFEERKKYKQQKLVEDVKKYISGQYRPISREMLKSRFDGITRKVLDLVVADGTVLDYHNRYLSVDNISITSYELKEWKKEIFEVIREKNNVCHVKEIYDIQRLKYVDLYRKLWVDDFEALFGLISHLFSKELSFMRPYVALDRLDLVSPEVRLLNFVKESSTVAIEDIVQFARAIHYKIPNTLDFLMFCNGYILKNREFLIEEASLNLNISDIKGMEALIEEELEENDLCSAIRDLSCVAQFPIINVPWDEWLIYSVLRKYGSKLNLYTTAYQFRLSIPVISVKYHYVNECDLQNISKKHAGTISNIMETKVDDLDNLDELIEEFIDIDDIDFDDFDFEEDV